MYLRLRGKISNKKIRLHTVRCVSMKWQGKFVGVVMVTLFHLGANAQSSSSSALNRIEKGNWLKAEMQLRKALKKDTLNPEARYVYSLLFFHHDYPKYNIDSAYYYALASLSDFQK